MSNFTPGPWIYYADLPSQDPDWHIVTTENRLRILANVHIEPGNQVDEATARLIAAAPDLLEALIDAVCALECCGKDYPAAEKARTAIAKATGGAA